MAVKVVGIVGSYRKGKIIDGAVSAVLEGAEARGAETTKICLLDMHIEFCTNCRSCTQKKVEARRGLCVHNDDMENILAEIDDAEGVVLASPINFGTVTALMKRFIERLIPYGYWPWGQAMAPKYRISKADRKAVTITSSACPALLGRILMPNALSIQKKAARTIGAKVVKSLYFGPVAGKQDSQLSEKAFQKARKTGEDLVLQIQAEK
jgi:putative NADPH-quinone reductase